MDYNEIDVEGIVNEVVTAEEQGKMRNATKKETMAVRFAALNAIVKKMQLIVKNDKELVGV
jgi:phosphopantetheinyl transferase (holo-ACP synthase)